ncbi:MAG: TIGR02281 family clan AA aspartic protease [Maricaulaceae bacterium]
MIRIAPIVILAAALLGAYLHQTGRLDEVIAHFVRSEAPPLVTAEPSPAPIAAPSDGQTRAAVIPRRDNGQFRTQVRVNGRWVDMLVDTGASVVVLTAQDADKVGFDRGSLLFTARANTANGVAKAAPVRLDRVQIGSITLRDVPAAVMEPEALNQSLLGMSFLGELSEVNANPRQMVLRR